MSDEDSNPATRQELVKVRDDLSHEVTDVRKEVAVLRKEVAKVRDELVESIRVARSEFRWLFGLLLAALIGGSAILLPLAMDRVVAEIRAATSEAVRTLEGDIRYLEGRVDATD